MKWPKPVIFAFYSIRGGVGKTTLATALAYYLYRQARRDGWAVLLWGADWEKNDTVHRYFGREVPGRYDWAAGDPPLRNSTYLYLYSSKIAHQLYQKGRVEEAVVALAVALARLAEVLEAARAPVAAVVLDLPKGMPPTIKWRGHTIEVLELLREVAHMIYVADYDELPLLSSSNYTYQFYTSYASSMILNKVPRAVFRQIVTSGYKMYVEFVQRLIYAPDAEATYKAIRSVAIAVDSSGKRRDLFSALISLLY
jgi:hypothetical protein